MNTDPTVQRPTATPAAKVSIKIFGVGGAGVSMVEQMLKSDFAGASFVTADTAAHSLAASSAAEKLHLETKLLRGLGTGGDPDRGRAVAEEHAAKLKAMCDGAEVVFIVAGLGGGAGTGISPVLARAAREAGALALAFVTLPFDCEGNRRQRQAQQGLEQLKAAADGVICLPNQKVFKLLDENTSVVETFKITSRQLLEGARGVWRLLTHTGLIEIHFADLCALLRDRHAESCIAAVEAAGTTRSHDAAEKLLAHPMLDGGQALAESDAVLVSLMGGPDLTMADVNRVMEQIGRQCEQAQVIMGAAIDEAFKDRLAVTVIAARRNGREKSKPHAAEAAPEISADDEAAEFDTQLLHRAATGRPASRFVPPPPVLTPDQREQFIAKQTGAGARQRKAARLRQTQLPLEIVSKGRFDKTEPTVHKGEDLDVPTYIRRGVALN
jgi:cell division protein FtsZ